MVTKVKTELVELNGALTLAQKLAQFVSVLEYGAATGNSAATNSAAINLALAAASGGFVIVPPGINYTESSLAIPDDVCVLVFKADGKMMLLTSSYSASPLASGGFEIKQNGVTGILLRAVDNGVVGEPLLQLVNSTDGSLAALDLSFAELTELSTAPATPASNKVRVFPVDDGSGNTVLKAKFSDGTVLSIVAKNDVILTGSTTYDPASLADGAGVTTTLTVDGAVLGDFVEVSFSNNLAGVILTGYVSAANTVSVRFQNETAGVVDLASGTITARIVRKY